MSVVAPVAAAIRSVFQKPFRVFSSGGATYGYWKDLGRTYGQLGQYTYGDMEFERVLVMPVDAVNATVSSHDALVDSSIIVAASITDASFSAQDARVAFRQTPDVATSIFEALDAEVESSRTAQGGLAGAEFASNGAQTRVGGIASEAANALWEAHSASTGAARTTPVLVASIAISSPSAESLASIGVDAVRADAVFEANGAEVARGVSPASVNATFTGHGASKQSPRTVQTEAVTLVAVVPEPTVVATGFAKPPAWQLTLEAQPVTVQSSCTRATVAVEASFAAQTVALQVARTASAFEAADAVAAASNAQPLSRQPVQPVGIQSAVPLAERVAVGTVLPESIALALAALPPQPRIRQFVSAAAVLVSGIAVERAVTRAVQPDAAESVFALAPPSLIIAAKQKPSILSLLFGVPRPFPRRIDDPILTDWEGDVYRNAPTPPPQRRHYLRGIVRKR